MDTLSLLAAARRQLAHWHLLAARCPHLPAPPGQAAAFGRQVGGV